MVAGTTNAREPWRARLYIPNYRVIEAAKYARVSSKTVTSWQSEESGGVLSVRDDGVSLSYMQLIELAVVAAFREAKISLRNIREAREFIKKQVKSEYPFADYRFKTDGKNLLMDYAQIDKRGVGKLLELNKNGQLAWSSFLDDRLREFQYDKKQNLVLRWHVAGPESPVIIDPRVSFGAPAVKGIPTWAIKGRWSAGETLDEIADDFALKEDLVLQALQFEGVNLGSSRKWVN